MHAMLLMIIVSVMLTIVPLYFLELMLVIMGAELRINVILDLILIYWAGLGIAEAAWGYDHFPFPGFGSSNLLAAH